ncbi:MAG: MotA/TolQ/ExbB proton channel family protein [Planctomycetota bacterium]
MAIAVAFGMAVTVNWAWSQSVETPATPDESPVVKAEKDVSTENVNQTPRDTNEPQAPTTINYLDPKEVMERGGPLMWPILLCSLVTITFGFERLISLRRRRVIPPKFTRQFMEELVGLQLDRNVAMRLCAGNGSPMANVFQAAVRHWGRPSVEIEQSIAEAGQREISLLRRNLRILQGSANIATLLGLLGTIVGMIQAFNDVAVLRGLGRAEVLASGIAQALLTTAAGLAVAIPSIILYTYFAGRVERLVQQMDEHATRVVDAISAESGASSDRPGDVKATGGKVVPRYVS